MAACAAGMMEGVHRPYLNANLYRNHAPANSYSHLDMIDVGSDGSTMVGRSDLTSRIWNSIVQISNSPQEALLKADKKAYPEAVLSNGISDGRFFPDPSKMIIVDDGGEITLYARAASWSAVAQTPQSQDTWSPSCNAIEHDEGILSVDIFPSGDKIITGGADCCIKVWDPMLIPSASIRPAHAQLVCDVAANRHDENAFISCGMDGVTALWDTRSILGKANVLSTTDYGARCACWISEKHILTGYDSGEIMLMDVSQPTSSLVTVQLNYPIHKILYSERLKCIAVCGESETVSVYQVLNNSNLTKIQEFNLHQNYARSVAWHHIEPILYSCGWDGKVFEMDLKTLI